jgi:hypothetical protein
MVDVKWAHNKYWLVANTGNLHDIVLLLSDDGERFYPFDGGSGKLIEGGPNYLVTPEITVLSPTTINVNFGYGNGEFAFRTIQSWTFNLLN